MACSQMHGGVPDSSLSEDSVPPLPPPLQLSPSLPHFSHCIPKLKQLSCSTSKTAKRPFKPLTNHTQLLSFPPPATAGNAICNVVCNIKGLIHNSCRHLLPSLVNSIPHSPEDFNATVSSVKVIDL